MLIYIKILVSIVIIYICTCLGNLKAKSYENRVFELKKMKNALNMFKTKIEFTYEPIKDIFKEISHIIYKENDNVFKTTVQNNDSENISETWTEAVDISKSIQNKDDKETIKMLGKLLGRVDKIGQISQIDLTNSFIDKQIENAECERNKNFKLYKILGTVLGIAVVIILI